MDQQRAQPRTSEAEYDTIEAALLETARGRWFLSEFARRNRTADTGLLLDAIRRLQQAVGDGDAAPSSAPARPQADGIGPLIARARREVAAASAARAAPERAFEAVAEEAEQAAAAMLAAAAETEDLGLALRTAGAEDWLQDEIGRCADTIRAAGARQDLAARHVGRLVRTLQAIEARLAPSLALPEPAADPEAEPDDGLFGDDAPAPAVVQRPAQGPSLELVELREHLRRLA